MNFFNQNASSDPDGHMAQPLFTWMFSTFQNVIIRVALTFQVGHPGAWERQREREREKHAQILGLDLRVQAGLPGQEDWACASTGSSWRTVAPHGGQAFVAQAVPKDPAMHAGGPSIWCVHAGRI